MVANAEQNRCLGEVCDPCAVGDLLEVQGRGDSRAVVEEIRGPKVVLHKLLAARRPAAVDAVTVARQRFVECRQRVARLADLRWIADIEEVAVDDRSDAERDTVQLGPKTTILRGDGSCHGQACVFQPHGELRRIRETLEQRRKC
ncbi:hypothetical protein [Segeticoccus rhizosphaerae]|uniref:hypothetical protein n=1 Tax=Segeticoccus rhizosphaerae TaxID=1104777 RepID=UPI0019399659|nr:hypothetical protein [Segeticoccus rhizosphaerae]